MIVQKRILIIAGPNGAGKTTFATEFLPHEAGCPIFVNADAIAAGLSPFQPSFVAFRAGRLMIEIIRDHARKGDSFAFETTLSGRRHARSIPHWQTDHYRVTLFFLRLPTPDMAVARVQQRVDDGGHAVPEDIVRRRFRAGWSNFKDIYQNLVDDWVIHDNAGPIPVCLASGGKR